jgi:surface antigen/peptidoglycan hydrolase CwlO-like protein
MKQKTMKKIVTSNRFQRLVALPIVVVAAVFAVGAVYIPAHADQYDEKITAIQRESNTVRNSLGDLQSQAVSYQDAINKLQAQINSLQAAINANLAQQAKLQTEIDNNQIKLAAQKQLLATTIKTMYIDGQPSTLEMLASSGNLSDFVDKEEYRSAVQNKIQDTLTTIRDLQKQLQTQKEQIDGLLKDQQTQQATQAAAKAQQDQMLAYNQSQQSDYNAKLKDNAGKIAELRSQQAAENARLFAGADVIIGGSCDTAHGDTYPTPWCNSGQDSMLDYWGMYNRECVSYTAWKVYESGRHMPYWGGIGNANQWDDNARQAGIPVDGTPRSGDVAIKNSMPYGHAMYVESVNSNGTINISQYNADLAGHFSRVYNMNPAGLVFVHF